MRKRMAVAVGLLLGVCAANGAEAQTSARERFVPPVEADAYRAYGGVTNWSQLAPLDETAWAGGRIPVPTGATWSRLGPGPGKEAGTLFLVAHAGIGDTFPVQDKQGRTRFAVIVTDGDDDHLLIVVHTTSGVQRIDVWRDKSVPVQVGGGTYELSYPSVSVGAARDAKPTTDKAMIIVTCRPR